jgi:hypothetical protein
VEAIRGQKCFGEVWNALAMAAAKCAQWHSSLILPNVGESLHCDIGMVAQLFLGFVDRTSGHA